MPQKRRSRPILEVLPPSPWMKKVVEGIPYWVHVPTRHCGIHIRGLARLCGVDERALRGIIQKATKTEGEVRNLRASEIHNQLKDKVIFMEEVRNLGPAQQGGPVKVICSNVCTIFIRYYASKGREVAVKSALKFMDFGLEQFIYTQVGFISRPESVVLADIEYLIAKETVQVNKSRQEEARFFTNPLTGECGIALKSLSFLCGGVALKQIEGFLEAQNEPFLQRDHPEQIVKATVCTQALHHFGFERRPRKTVAQHWAKALDPMVPTLHQKTHYQAPVQTDRETQLESRLEALEKENARLRQLAKVDELDGPTPWHRILGRVLESALPERSWEIRLETETTKVTQFLDLLILKRPTPPSSDRALPDGLRADVEIGLLTYKSHQESLTPWAIQELVNHYVAYRKSLVAQNQQPLPEADRFQLYAVTTLYPSVLEREVGAAWQRTEQVGIYQLAGLGLRVIVIVTSQVSCAPHNHPWNLLSRNPEHIRYALEQQPLPADLQRYFAHEIDGEGERFIR